MNNNIDWANIGFSYRPTEYRYSRKYVNGAWQEGGLIKDDILHISECAGVIQYAQTGFEGMKVYTTKDGRIVTFRPELNAKRLQDTCDRLIMPKIEVEDFVKAVDELVLSIKDMVPPYGSGATLYLRPFIYGSGIVIGIKPAPEYEFRIFGTPVGPYFKGDIKPLRLTVSPYDRAAPAGSGNIKAGLNYAMSIYPGYVAKNNGFDENMYLDAKTRTFVEETGGANFIFITKDNKLVTPKSDTILPSITRRSIVEVAQTYLGMEVEERPVRFDEISDFVECAICGTAAIMSPVGYVYNDDQVVKFANGTDTMGPVITKLRQTLLDMQLGIIEAPSGWLHEIK